LIIIKNTTEIKSVEVASNKLLSKLAEPYYVDDLELITTGSIGIAVFPRHATHSTKLIQQADKAMYKAKDAGRNCFVVYSDDEPTPETNQKKAPLDL